MKRRIRTEEIVRHTVVLDIFLYSAQRTCSRNMLVLVLSKQFRLMTTAPPYRLLHFFSSRSKEGKHSWDRVDLYKRTLRAQFAIPRLVKDEKNPLAAGMVARELIDEVGGLEV